MKNFLVSVLITCHNSVNYLNSSLDSILKQTYKNIEIICLDDCSKDDTFNKLKDYEKKYDFIKVFKNETNMGISYSRNKLISLAQGKYFIFLDHDDFMKKKSIEILVKKSVNGTVDIVSGKAWSVFNVGKSLIKLPFFPISSLFYKRNKFHFVKRNICTAWMNLFRKEFWDSLNVEFLPRHNFEDFGLIPFIFLSSNTIKFVDTRLYYYYRRPVSISRFDDKNAEIKIQDLLIQWKYLINLFNKRNLLNDFWIKRSLNGVFIVLVYAIIKLRKHFWNDKDKFLEITEKIYDCFEENKLLLKFSKTIWKSITFFACFFYLKKLFYRYKKNKRLNLKKLRFLENIK